MSEYIFLPSNPYLLTGSLSIKRYLEIAGNSDYFDGDAKVEASLKALGLPNLSTLLPGMEVALMPHQVIGVDWMLKQEACATRRGGILADEMGLVSPPTVYHDTRTDLYVWLVGENCPSVGATLFFVILSHK
jgi:hypothetical protein